MKTIEISTTYLIIRPVRDYFVTRYKLPSVFLFSLIFSFSPSLIFFGLNLNIFPCFEYFPLLLMPWKSTTSIQR